MFRTAHVLLLLHIIIYLFLFIINFTRRRVENRDSRLVTEKIWYVLLYCFPFSPHKRLRFPFALKKA